MGYRNAGISVVELLVVLVVLAFLLLNTAMPGLGHSRESKLADGLMLDIVSAIAMARQTAVSEARMVTICRSDDGRHCQGRWHEGSIIFTDRNADRIINGDDRLLARLDPPEIAGQLTFNSFRNRQYLQLTPRGITNYQNGNFTFCPANGDSRLARQVIVSLSGRTRWAKDRDGDGIVENSRGDPVSCD